MTRTVGALVERGLVLRQDDPLDRRSVILSLTEDGRRSIAAIRRKRDAWMASRVAKLTPEEQDVLARATVILTKVAGE
jgi:DNA-binding MarR family transcriptional regulator